MTLERLVKLTHRHQLRSIIDTKSPAAEIGVASGIFSEEILSWGIPLLYAVDHWKSTIDFEGDSPFPQDWHDNNLEQAKQRLKTRTVFLRGESINMAKFVTDESLGFIYLDACHTEECVIADLLAWYPKLKCGGIMAGHDIVNPAFGVLQAVNAFTKGLDIEYFITDEQEMSSFYFKKPC